MIDPRKFLTQQTKLNIQTQTKTNSSGMKDPRTLPIQSTTATMLNKNATPIFKTPEEALAYANQNNIKVAGSTNVAPTIASTSVQPKTVSISSQIKNVQPEEKTSFFDRLKNAGLSNEQNDKLNEQINDLDNPILNGMKRNQEFNKKANAVEKGSAKSFGANSIDAIVDTGQYVKNAFKSEMKKEQREDLELAQKLQNGFRGTRNQMTDEQANEFINYVKNKYNVTDFAKALNDVNEWTYQENELEKATNNMVSNINEENSKLGKVGQRITSAFGSVGRITPTIAANIALPGSGMPVMFANSAQSAQDEALRNGATYDQAVFNGMLSGALEVGTEAIGGERIGKLTGIPTLTNKFGISTGIFGEIASEEIEEMISTTVQPLIDRITYNPNAPLATKEDYWNTFVDTALSTGVLIGIGDVVNYRNRAIEQVENSNMTQEQKQQSILEIEKGANEIINQIQEPNLQNSTQNNTNLANLDTNNMQISQNNVQTTEQSLGMQQIKKVELPSEIQTFVDNRNKISPGLSVELDNTLNTDGVIIKNSDGTRTMKINPNSTRAYEFVAIHEMLHDLEGTQEYQELSNFVKERATTQEGFEEAKKAITEQYTKYYQENGLDMSGLNMDVETTNDMTAQALGNQEFLNELAGNKPNVFMRMYNWIKNVLFNGQKTGKTFAERRAQNKYLQELKSKFEVAYNTAYKGNTIQNYSIGYDIDNHPFIVIDEDILQNIPEDKWIKVVKETLKNKFPNGIDMDFFNIGINAKSRNEYVNSEYTKDIKKNETEKYKDKLRMANNIDEIVRNAYNVRNESLKHKRKDSFGSFNRSNIDVKIGNNDYTIDIVTGINKNNDEILYDIVNIKKKTSPIRFSTNVGSKNGTSSNNSIPSNNGAVNSQYMQNSSNNTQGLENSSSFSFNTIRNDIANADLNAEAKPHGLYVSNLFETDKNTFTYPFKDGELNTTYEIKVTPRNPLEVENFYMKTSRANDEILVDVGVSALKKLVANEEFDRINTLNKEQLIKELENKYPGYDYTKYYDKLELLAAYGAQLARAKGYDAIVAKKSTNSIKEIQDIENEISILKNDIMSVKNNNAENSNKSSFSLPKNSNLKELQLAIIEKYNPMRDDYHTGIRSVDDIKTFDEVINDDESFVWGDFSQEDAKKALEKGKIIVYSSKPIVQGGFVSTSKNQARDYAANGKIYSKEVNLNDVAWINGDEGQYAKVDDISFSQFNDKWQSYLDKNWDLMPDSKKTFGFPTNEQLQAMDNKKIAENVDTLNLKEKKIKSLEDIADMTEDDLRNEKGVNYKHKKDKNTQYERKFFENAETSKIINQDIKDTIEITTYERQANEETLAKANEKLDEQGDKLIKQWQNKTKNFTAEDVAIGAILIERYQQMGDTESAVNVVQKLADMGTEVGRAVQMYSIFQRLTPDAMMIYQQRKLNDVFKEVSQRKTGEWVEANKEKFKLTADDSKFITEQVEKAQQATNERQKQIELAKIESRINDKLPPERGQTIKAIRRIAMLFNPKTQVRNVVGNALIMPVNDVVDFIGTQIDKAIAKKTGIRTTNYANLKEKAKGFKKGITESIEDYKLGIRTEPTGSKYEFDFGGKAFDENTKSEALNYINNKMNGINNLLDAVMSGGDRPFYEAAFNNSLQGQMKANNVTTPTSEMIDIAVNEALSRTWNDSNNYTQAVLGIRRQMNKLNIGGFGLGDLIIPFAKTPANLTKAMVEYSPLGTIEAIINYSDMKKAISRGEMTAQQQKNFVNSTSKAIAGSILYLIAGALAQTGAITGSADDDKDVRNFEQNVLGIQPYSIKIGDKTFTYSWANPLNAPLAIMADTYKMSKENAGLFDILTNGFKTAGEVIVDNSFLQGIKELFEADSISEGLTNAVVNMPSQFIPTFLSQFATFGDKNKRQTFEYGDKLKTTTNQIKNKIPRLKNTLAPAVNTFGEEVESYGGDNNIFNVFINPANVSEANATNTQKELYALYEATKDKTIFPRQAPYYLSDDGEKINLSSHERAEYQKISGKYVSENLGALFDSEFYKTLENEQKVEVINEIVSDADTIAKDNWIDTNATKKIAERNEKLKDVPLVDYYNAWIAQKDVEGKKNLKGETISGTKKKAKIKAINEAVDDDLTAEQKKILYGIFNLD